MIPAAIPVDIAGLSIAMAIFYYFETGVGMKMFARSIFLWCCVLSTWEAFVITGQQAVEYLFVGELFITLFIIVLDFIIPVLNFIAGVMSKRDIHIGGK